MEKLTQAADAEFLKQDKAKVELGEQHHSLVEAYDLVNEVAHADLASITHMQEQGEVDFRKLHSAERTEKLKAAIRALQEEVAKSETDHKAYFHDYLAKSHYFVTGPGKELTSELKEKVIGRVFENSQGKIGLTLTVSQIQEAQKQVLLEEGL